MSGALLLALLVGAAGCTMCPDPFDYSGPVPNGSVPQNNFQARSNGIIPLGMTPRPWPRVVRADTASPPLAEVEDGPDNATASLEPAQPASVLVGEASVDPSAAPAILR
ncbi:MAG: hypothetical protein EBZ59_02345 [Planctomycetia bacterium]|nr:hypothetical protein [Planctomycetia bacterium]